MTAGWLPADARTEPGQSGATAIKLRRENARIRSAPLQSLMAQVLAEPNRKHAVSGVLAGRELSVWSPSRLDRNSAADYVADLIAGMATPRHDGAG
jgi:hypothetical protein